MADEPNPTEDSQSPQDPAAGGDDIAPDIADALASAQAAISQFSDEVGSSEDAGAAAPVEEPEGIDMLGDVELNVAVELGRTEMLVEDVLRLSGGSVVELDKLAGDPVDVIVNQRLVARGEVLVLNDNFCIRISEIVDDLEEQAQSAAFGG